MLGSKQSEVKRLPHKRKNLLERVWSERTSTIEFEQAFDAPASQKAMCASQ